MLDRHGLCAERARKESRAAHTDDFADRSVRCGPSLMTRMGSNSRIDVDPDSWLDRGA
jgi:hypothetical protein